ncbi:hypothetical protein I4U23_018333 [Adineta vaga]|nr:hypothetical protein I4U23_018333 [Adineta vaga]
MASKMISTTNNSLKRTLPNEFTSRPSSDSISELRRLATFQSWKENRNPTVSKSKLAKTGFTYDENVHKIKCAICDFEFDLHQMDIDPMEEHLEQSPECKFALLRNEFFNKTDQQLSHLTASPTSQNDKHNSNHYEHIDMETDNHLDDLSSPKSFLRTLSNIIILQLRSNTFSNWPLITPSAKDMIDAGWSYTNIGDRVICLDCNALFHRWENTDMPYEIHRLKSPRCLFVLSYEKRTINTSPATITITTAPKTQVVVGAANTTYKLACHRHESFKNWPHTEENPLPSIESFVDAGFFYTGEGTIVKCFYCNNALRNWQGSDDPKIEHARWYPECAYIRQYMGEDLYQAIQRKNQQLKTQQNNVTNQKSQINLWTNDEIDRMVKARLDLPIIEKLRQTGFTMPIIRKSFEMQLKFKKDDFKTDNDLRYGCLILHQQVKLINGNDSIILVPQNWIKTYSDDQQQQKKAPVTKTPQLPVKTNSESQKVSAPVISRPKLTQKPNDETILCVLCLEAERQIACLPCGHLTSCVACGHGLRVCPICRAPVKAFVRIYM